MRSISEYNAVKVDCFKGRPQRLLGLGVQCLHHLISKFDQEAEGFTLPCSLSKGKQHNSREKAGRESRLSTHTCPTGLWREKSSNSQPNVMYTVHTSSHSIITTVLPGKSYWLSSSSYKSEVTKLQRLTICPGSHKGSHNAGQQQSQESKCPLTPMPLLRTILSSMSYKNTANIRSQY